MCYGPKKGPGVFVEARRHRLLKCFNLLAFEGIVNKKMPTSDEFFLNFKFLFMFICKF